MLQQLTAQLINDRQLHIPYVGTFKLEHHHAVLQFADRLLHPPYAEITFLASSDGLAAETAGGTANESLNDFGLHLKSSLASGPFFWSGLGTLQLQDDEVVFDAEKNMPLLPVPAHKVLRENRKHAILVGDQQQSSSDTSFINEALDKKRTWLWIGWVILIIALLFIVWMLYTDGPLFGSKIKAGTAYSAPLQKQIIRS